MTKEAPRSPHRAIGHDLALCVMIAGFCTALFGLLPLRTWDTWWHLAMGDVIHAFQAVPIANHFAFAVPPLTPSVVHEWLAQMMMARVVESQGIEGLLTLRNLLFFISVVIITLTPERLTARARIVAGGLSAALLGASMYATPTMLVTPLFALCVWAVWRLARSTRKAACVVAMLIPPAVTIFWANVDIAYALTALLTAYAAGRAFVAPASPGRRLQRIGWSLSTIACLLVPLINPRGAALIPHTLDVMMLYPMHPDAKLWSHLFTSSHAIELGLVMVSVIAALLGIKRRDAPIIQRVPELVLLGLLTFFAVTHLRAMMWLALCLPCLMAPALSHELFTRPVQLVLTRNRSIALALGGMVLALSTQPLFVWRASLIEPLAESLDLRRVQPHQYSIKDDVPVESLELLAQHSVAPRVWASKKYEGYILYKLLPKQVTAITFTDARLEMIPQDVARLRALMREDEDLWRGIFQGYKVGAALLDITEDESLISALKDHADWQLVHTQGSTYYFVRVVRAPA